MLRQRIILLSLNTTINLKSLYQCKILMLSEIQIVMYNSVHKYFTQIILNLKISITVGLKSKNYVKVHS